MNLPLLLGLLLQVSPLAGGGDDASCPQGRISNVFIDNHSIFDASSLPEDDRLRWAYRLANRLHVQTRREFIEDQLLFTEGECYDEALVRESARLLREYRFIAGADAFPVEQPDGTTHIVVDTRDEWTTKVSLLARFDGGFRMEGAQVVEENFLGRGIALGAFYRSRDEQRDVGVGVEIPRIRGSGWDAHVALGATRIGELVDQEIVFPFRGERPGIGVRQKLLHRRDFFTYVVDSDDELTHLVVPVQEERVQLSLARRTGRPGDLVVLGGGLSWERVGGGTRESVEGVANGEFSSRVTVEPDLTSMLDPHLRNRQALRLSVLAGVRDVRYEQRSGLDAVGGVQDIPFGKEAHLTVGPSVAATGSAGHDVWAGLETFAGGTVGRGLGFAGFTGEARQDFAEGWRDVLVEAWALGYRPVEGFGGPVLVLRGAAHAGWSTTGPFQLLLGGPDGVRGYSDRSLPGGRRLVGTGEARWRVPHPFGDLADLGVTVFGDVGRMWAGDAPFGVDSGWRSSLGAGLRVGFPAGSSSVIRFDVAIPVEGADRRPMIRIAAREWIGLLDDARNLQLMRSRRSGLDPEFTGVARVRRPPR